MSLPIDNKARKQIPLYQGLFVYFPDALAAVAEVSRVGNEQHNPGQPIHLERRAADTAENRLDCALRHLQERGTLDVDGARHLAKTAWNILYALQLECEEDEQAKHLADSPSF